MYSVPAAEGAGATPAAGRSHPSLTVGPAPQRQAPPISGRPRPALPTSGPAPGRCSPAASARRRDGAALGPPGTHCAAAAAAGARALGRGRGLPVLRGCALPTRPPPPRLRGQHPSPSAGRPWRSQQPEPPSLPLFGWFPSEETGTPAAPARAPASSGPQASPCPYPLRPLPGSPKSQPPKVHPLLRMRSSSLVMDDHPPRSGAFKNKYLSKFPFNPTLGLAKLLAKSHSWSNGKTT